MAGMISCFCPFHSGAEAACVRRCSAIALNSSKSSLWNSDYCCLIVYKITPASLIEYSMPTEDNKQKLDAVHMTEGSNASCRSSRLTLCQKPSLYSADLCCHVILPVHFHSSHSAASPLSPRYIFSSCLSPKSLILSPSVTSGLGSCSF